MYVSACMHDFELQPFNVYKKCVIFMLGDCSETNVEEQLVLLDLAKQLIA